MPTLNEVKEQMIVVASVGDFTNALQQIATIRMMKLKDKVIASRRFVETTAELLTELITLRNDLQVEDLVKLEKKAKSKDIVAKNATHANRSAVIVITSNQGLTGRYNIEIYQKIEKILEVEKDSDFYVIGKKGQEVFQNGKFKVQSYPYEVPDNFGIEDLRRLIALFDYYGKVTLVYSHYVNSAIRDVVALSVVNPALPPDDSIPKMHGKYTYEPDIDHLILGVTKKLQAALFQQQILDARLAQFSAQMIGMKTASDNANDLLGELRVDYNKQRRKMIDKKISEVFAGSALW
jgi:F-type H+-transporting ATPase subunit gamma